uniref:Uncharacterized protein n=1 Tax=Magallana gigas TaxID=29159 RepID=A0A8W8INN3_MAGGI
MSKPELPRGYLGAQPKFSEFKLSTLSHNEPLTIPNADGTVNFKAVVPKGKQVAVTVNDTWTQLKNAGSDVWEGAVKIVKNSRVTLNVNYGGDESKYSTLLEYNL